VTELEGASMVSVRKKVSSEERVQRQSGAKISCGLLRNLVIICGFRFSDKDLDLKLTGPYS
jgi:hypothetical protein